MIAKVIRQASGEWMVFHRFQPLLTPLFSPNTPVALLRWKPSSPRHHGPFTNTHSPFFYIYMTELSAPDGRIPTTFSRFSLDSDTLLTFSTHPSSFSLYLSLPFSHQNDDRPKCSRLFKIGNRVGSTSVRAIHLGESRQGLWSISW